MRLVHHCSPILCIAVAALGLSGCTSLTDYVHHGFKVGPEYTGARAAVAPHWIDAGDVDRIKASPADLSRWWCVFNDPVLNGLVTQAYAQNITLKEAGARVLQARAELGITAGEIFPQSQAASGSYLNTEASVPAGSGLSKYGTSTNLGFSLAWELDFWGRFRRAIIASEAQLQGSVEDYDQVLVTLVGDVASNYVQMRQAQQQIELSKKNVELQTEVLTIVKARNKEGTISDLDLNQAEANLAQTKATIPSFEISLRQTQNAICTLLGIPPVDLQARLGNGPIPAAPPEVVVGVPAQLLERRPDVRRAERNAAAQSEEIGIAMTDWYPHIAINGSLGYSSQNFSSLFSQATQNGSVGPTFQWNVLEYGRIANNVRLQDYKFQESLLIYRQTVLNANQEAENGLITYLKAHERAKDLLEAVVASSKATNIVISQYKAGKVDFTTVATIEQSLVTQSDAYAQSLGQIDQGLIQVYRALGGGWELRLGSNYTPRFPQPPAATGTTVIPEIPTQINTPPANGNAPAPGRAAGTIPEPTPLPPVKP